VDTRKAVTVTLVVDDAVLEMLRDAGDLPFTEHVGRAMDDYLFNIAIRREAERRLGKVAGAPGRAPRPVLKARSRPTGHRGRRVSQSGAAGA
jgi:hypothetical protein